MEKTEAPWEEKPLHAMDHCQIEEVAGIRKSYHWLEKAILKDSTDVLSMAAQVQALSTKSDRSWGPGWRTRIVAVDKHQNRAVVVDVAISID